MHILQKVEPELKVALEPLFAEHQRVDMAIESILAGQSGGRIRIIVDDLTHPQVAQTIQASFTIFAGDHTHQLARQLLEELPPRCFIMPSPAGWIQLAYEIHGDRLEKRERYSFSPDSLDLDQLKKIVAEHPYADGLERIDLATAQEMLTDPLNKFHFVNYDSPEDFVQTGFGYCVKSAGQVVAACSSGLVCQSGVEICIIVQPEFRRKGLATLVGARFLIDCLEKHLHPNWDAANLFSKGLAEKLGYTYVGAYPIYYIDQND